MNDRETAALIWLAIAFASAVRSRDLRAAAWDVVKSFAHPVVLLAMLGLAAWTAGVVAVGRAFGLWEPYLRNDTVVWFITVGVAFLLSLGAVSEDGFFRRSAARAIAVAVFVEGFVNLTQFGLLVELLLLPSLTFLGVFAVVTEERGEHATVHRYATQLCAFAGLGLIVLTAIRLWPDFDAARSLRALALPAWLTAGVVPFIYLVGLGSAYRAAFVRIEVATHTPTKRRRAKWALLRAAHLRAAELGGFTGHWISDLACCESSREARRVAQRWRKAWRGERYVDRMEDARDSMEEWLRHTDPALQEIWADALERSWDRLDRAQRATLKAETLRRALERSAARYVRALPG